MSNTEATTVKMPHIQLDASIHATAAILPGDPARVDAIAAFLTDVREEGFNREYKSITGTYKGRRILAISTGMGGPSTAICVEELADLGVTDLIRIGSCGALQRDLRLGQLVICDRAVCDDGTSQTYLDTFAYAAPELAYLRKPDHNGTSFTDTDAVSTDVDIAARQRPNALCCAPADSSLTNACIAMAQKLRLPYAVGPTRSHDALYLKKKPELDAFYSTKGVFASDMETASLFAVGAIRHLRTASILNTVVEWEADLRDGISSYKDREAAAARGEQYEILLALETLADIPC